MARRALNFLGVCYLRIAGINLPNRAVGKGGRQVGCASMGASEPQPPNPRDARAACMSFSLDLRFLEIHVVLIPLFA